MDSRSAERIRRRHGPARPGSTSPADVAGDAVEPADVAGDAAEPAALVSREPSPAAELLDQVQAHVAGRRAAKPGPDCHRYFTSRADVADVAETEVSAWHG